ncbi:MAG TPA: hypothetical protein VK030_02865 [Actinomycetales bacterium]|nr:hypothetical protein [Actinomycetales bacterium]
MEDNPFAAPKGPVQPPRGSHGGPPRQIPGAPTPQRTPRPPREVDPELAQLGRRRLLHFASLMLLGLLSSNLPLPWQIIATVAFLAALVTGVRALITLWKAHVRGAALPMIVMGLVLSGILLASSVTLLALWPLQMERQNCLHRAITVSAQEQCEAEFEDGLKRLLNTDQISNPFGRLFGT